MTEEANKALQIENLVLKLNAIALQRMALHDQIWSLEEEGEKLRKQLVDLITKDCKS